MSDNLVSTPVTVKLKTNLGDITLQLDSEKTPKTAENFVTYVKNQFYNGTIFHRVIEGFMIQGGGFTETMDQKETSQPILNEANQGGKNKRGTIAMARTSQPHSATAQFFINVVDNSFLDFKNQDVSGWGYCVFGKVTEGMEVVDAICQVNTTSKKGHQDVPVEPILIQEAVIC